MDEPRTSAESAGDQLIEVRVASITAAARDINVYELSRADGLLLPFASPGAHIDLHLAPGLVRQYSLTVPDPVPAMYAIAVKREAEGRGGSRFVHEQLRPGATVSISAPRNNFPLDENARRNVLIAGGIGITPIWCMVQRLAALGRAWELHYACRSRQDAAFGEALAALAPARLHFDDEAGGVLDIAGIVAAAPADAHLYCCGPLPMLAAFEAATAQWPRGQVHVEYFTPREAPAVEGGFVVQLRRSGREVCVPPGATILETLRAAGLQPAASCEAGICGTCETRVIAGIPDHRDQWLSDSERASNTTVMICCAGCKSERLVLDL
jgi:tetrachlorobenzoquinone reductase